MLAKLDAQLAEAVGPKARKPIMDAFARETQVLKGHIKEAAQKWGNSIKW